MYLLIENDGEISIEALTLIGVSSKESQNDKIGFFGSGNKYAISTLLRNKIDFKIYSGLKELKIELEKIDFRSETFERIIIDGQKTSMTTRMGPKWELWYCLREFVSNAIDENNEKIVMTIVEDMEPKKNKTQIYIELNKEIQCIYDNWEMYFANNDKIIFKGLTGYGKINILENNNNQGIIYRKGIRVVTKYLNTLFSYDFDNVDINESRLIPQNYLISERIASILTICNDKKIINKFLNANIFEKEYFELNLYWQYSSDKFSDIWANLLKDYTIIPNGIVQFIGPEDLIGNIVLQNELVDKLKKQFPELNYYNDEEAYIGEMEPDVKIMNCFKIALNNINKIGYDKEISGLNFIFVKMKNIDTLACFKKNTNIIAISINHPDDILEMESTILEEILHYKGYDDSSRRYENYLLKELIFCKKQLKEFK